jgi:lambda repressor-like predicted transcriptional regulator
VRLSAERIKALCESRGTCLGPLLAAAGVSRTAYYSLVRKESVLPKSVGAIARTLGVPPRAILDELPAAERKARDLAEEVDRIVRRHPGASREDVRHTLLLLEEPPIERLRRALIRGRAAHRH